MKGLRFQKSASVATASLFAAVEELEQGLVSAPTGISAGRADYANAFGVGTTLRYTPTLSGVKEDVILDQYRGKNTFSFTLSTGNLSVFHENGRYFVAESAEAEEKIFIGETWVYDSADHFEKGTLSVTQKAEGLYTLTIGASTAFLTDPDTVYPVYIDPSLEVSYGELGEGYIEDVTMFEGVPNINCGTFSYNTVGASSDYIRGRTAVRLPGLYESAAYQQLYSGQITSVEFCVNEASGTDEVTVGIYPLQSSTWTESGATWNNIGSHYGTAITTAKLDNSELAKFNITSLVQAWREIDNGSSSAGEYNKEKGFIMIAQDETTPNKQFYSSEYSDASVRPYVVMQYAAVVSIAGNGKTQYVAPSGTLQLTATTAPTGLPVTWSVSDISIATIDAQTGLLTGKKSGTTNVTAKVVLQDDEVISQPRKVIVTDLQEGIYRIKPTGNTLYLTAQALWQYNGMSITLEALSSQKTPSQYFVVEHLSTIQPYYTIRPLVSPVSVMVPYEEEVQLWDVDEGFSGGWNISQKTTGGYGLTYQKGGFLERNGAQVVVTDTEDTAWEFIACNEFVFDAKLFNVETGNEISSGYQSMVMGDKKTLRQMNYQPVFYSTIPDLTYSWSSSDPLIARVDSVTGDVTGIAPGQTNITATVQSGGLSKTVSYTVSVLSLPSGIYYLKNPSTLNAAVIASSGPFDGAFLTTSAPTADTLQLWQFTRKSDGYYTIKSAVNTNTAYYLSSTDDSNSVVLHSGTVTDNMKWALSITESRNFKLTNVASGKTLSFNNSFVTSDVYANDENYSDEWKIRSNEVYYVEHYYDAGFAVRYSQETVGYGPIEAIKKSERRYIELMDDLFGITIISSYHSFTSSADLCKATVTLETINDACSHTDADCLTTSAIRRAFVGDSEVFLPEVSRVLWTGHVLTNNASSDTVYDNKTTVITLRPVQNGSEYFTNLDGVGKNYGDTLNHELFHLLSLPDHYCVSDLYDNECKTCDKCNYHREQARKNCFMSKKDLPALCTDCYWQVIEYLYTLENNKVGE